MSVIQGNSTSGSGYSIVNSLRLRASASAYLSRTTGSAGNRTTMTYSGWVKRGGLGGDRALLSSTSNGGAGYETTVLRFTSTDQLRFAHTITAGTLTVQFDTTSVFRDPSAWYHVVLQIDTTQAVNASGVKLYVNGVLQAGSFAAYTQNAQIWWTSAMRGLQIGYSDFVSAYFDGYMCEVNFVDGQALDPNSFGQVDATTGQWVPKKYSGTYGTNGFYLPFNDGSNLMNLCLDRSGNGNNWTAAGVSLTTGATYDWMDDTPTNNYAVLNPLLQRWILNNTSLSNGALQTTNTTTAGVGISIGTILVSKGQYYFEASITTAGLLSDWLIGVSGDATQSDVHTDTVQYRASSGDVLIANVSAATWATYGVGDVIGVALDKESNQVSFYKNGALQGTVSLPTNVPMTLLLCSGRNGGSGWANFGQRPFAYTPPSGFKALCTKNLPTPSILKPKEHFDVVLATGANIKSTVEALYSDQALMVVKDRANANNWQWFNDVTGLSAVLRSNTTDVETTYSAPSGSSVGWVWKAGGAAVSNTAGSITSQVSANTTAGFSVVTYTGTGANATVGHGLGVAPKMVISKARTLNGGDSGRWSVQHIGLSANNIVFLNLTDAQSAVAGGLSLPTSLVFNAQLQSGLNTSGSTYVAYCFAEIPGFSKIGSYIGNGSSDGPFVYCGFRPRFVMVKCSSAAGGGWVIHDSARSPKNIADQRLSANISDAEYGSDGFGIDILSNGFKARTANGNWNSSGQTYIFYAVAEYPFNYSTAR